MDIATVIGLVLCVGAVIGSIFAGGDIVAFIDVPSLIVVGFGLIGATMIKWPMEVVKNLVGFAMKTIFFD
ncbi:MAG: motility protein A, partial [Deltaproteobacteria bacterium]